MTNKRFREIEKIKEQIDVLEQFVESINDLAIYVGIEDGSGETRKKSICIDNFVDQQSCSAIISDMKYRIRDRYEKLKEEYAKI